MEFTFRPMRGADITVNAKTAKQGAQLAAFRLWQGQRDDLLKPQSHTEISVTEPGPKPDDNSPGSYGVTYIAPSEKSSYTRATTLRLVF